MREKNFFECKGAIHVHSRFSDGEGSMEEIIEAANQAALDFVIITDHNDMRAKEYEGWHGKTLVLVGEEITRPEGNHILALGIEELISPTLSPQEAIYAVRAQGGISFLAHPFYQGSPIINDPPLPWRAWEVRGFDGLEVWNLTADLFQLLGTRGLECPKGDPLAYAAPNPAALRKWDELLHDRPVVGIGGLDAHAEKVARWGGKVLLPYKETFSALRMHLFLPRPLGDDLAVDSKLIYSALSTGRAFLAFEHYRPVDGFFCAIVGREEEPIALPGDTVRYSPHMELQVKLPHKAGLRVLRAGEEVFKQEIISLHLPLYSEGAYRLEVFLEGRYWIITNPFFVTRGSDQYPSEKDARSEQEAKASGFSSAKGGFNVQ